MPGPAADLAAARLFFRRSGWVIEDYTPHIDHEYPLCAKNGNPHVASSHGAQDQCVGSILIASASDACALPDRA